MKKSEELLDGEEMEQSTWSYLDDLHNKPIIEITKSELSQLFYRVAQNQYQNAVSSGSSLIEDDYIVSEGENRENALLKYLTGKIMKNSEIVEDHNILQSLADTWNNKHCRPVLISGRVTKIIKQAQKYGRKNLEDNLSIMVSQSLEIKKILS